MIFEYIFKEESKTIWKCFGHEVTTCGVGQTLLKNNIILEHINAELSRYLHILLIHFIVFETL